MAIVKRKSLPYDGTSWVSWFNSLNCPLITSASGTTITIDGIFTINKVANSNNLVIRKEDTATQLVYSLVASPCKVTVCFSDTLFYFQCQDNNACRVAFIYEKLSEDSFYGYNHSSASNVFCPINSITFFSMTTGIEYTHRARLNFTAQTGEISFTGDALFQAGVRDMADSNFISCSTVTSDQIYTFSLSNFYSVGPNTLVRMDLS